MAKSSEAEHPVKAFGWAARDPSGDLYPFHFSLRATRDHDVQFKVLYCGICRSDLHNILNDWKITKYPFVPGHEIVGIVTEVGSKVKKFKVGDKVGAGTLAETCRNCDVCSMDLENYCLGPTVVNGGTHPNGVTDYGGYSNLMVVDEHFVVLWPKNLPMELGAPLLCAGITVYSPLRYYGLDKPGIHVGIVGLGGLGHLAVKFAKAFGAKVTVISTSDSKRQEAIEKLGADAFLVSLDPEQMKAVARSLDGIIDTVSAAHPLPPLLNLLKANGKFIIVGAPEKPFELPVFYLMAGRKMVAASAIGGMKETQEMIDFAAKHSIVSDVEIIPMDYVNTAMERLQKSDVKYRFVIDIGNTLKSS